MASGSMLVKRHDCCRSFRSRETHVYDSIVDTLAQSVLSTLAPFISSESRLSLFRMFFTSPVIALSVPSASAACASKSTAASVTSVDPAFSFCCLAARPLATASAASASPFSRIRACSSSICACFSSFLASSFFASFSSSAFFSAASFSSSPHFIYFR